LLVVNYYKLSWRKVLFHSPGAAAPTLVVLKSSPNVDRCGSVVVQLIGLVLYSTIYVFKEVHLVTTPSLQTSYERVHWCCIHIVLGQTVPDLRSALNYRHAC